MQRLQGIAVSPGVAIGEALVMHQEGFRIPRRFVTRDAVDDERDRLAKALDAVAAEIAKNRDTVAGKLGPRYAASFEAHLQLLRDPLLRAELDEMIVQQHFSPEHAVSQALRRYAKVFQSLDAYMAERATDLFDLEKRLLHHLLGLQREELAHLTSPVLVLAHTLTPGEAASLNPQF